MAASPSPSPDDHVAIGSVLDGRYRIDAVLGTGGMGRVYRGEHTGIGRAVAIKVLHADLTRNREAAARFQREALASGRLDHPNIVGVSDFGVLDDGACYLVMEALEGESLGARLTRDKRLPWRDALEIMRGVLQGLRHAHERGVVHRDIKPDNIYLARKDHELVVKILDFGIAKLYAGTADDPASTRAGLTVGTPAYLSPEQAVGGEITPASDIYSCSILLYEMIAGRAPFEDKDPLAMLGAHVSRPPPPLAEVAPDVEVPPGLEDMLQRGLAKPSGERIASAADYLAWIDAILTGALGSAPVAMPAMSPPARLATPVPGSLRTPMPGAIATAAPSRALTPVPKGRGDRVSGSAPTATLDSVDTSMPLSTRAVSLAEAEPVPKRWLFVGAIVLAVLVVLAIVLALATRDDGEPAKPTKTKPTEPATPALKPPLPLPPAPSNAATVDRETRLKAALHDLVHGKTCADRRAAIPRIVELDDPSVVPELKRARYRMRGGILGIGDENTNACLVKDLDAALKKLTPAAPAPGK
ncbi:MAG TPA: protein kinase [Kofleriaceae bacterium]|nr:protein kinase [Kofleriaceae bacterium]